MIFSKIYLHERGFRYSFWLRLAGVRGWLKPLCWLMHHHYTSKYNVLIQPHTKIGKGFYLGHGMCIVIHPSCQIGNNVSLSQFLNIGSNKGKAAIIEDGAYIGPHVSLVEDVHIGQNATIGAGSVVTHDVPENSVAVGVPAKVIKLKE